MRCRKVRSFLSAYCNDELTGRRKLTIAEHLATCSECRREEAIFRSMSQVSRQLSVMNVSNDFNTILFNRLAQERFAATRTKAFLPKRAPVILWRRTVPTLAIACLATLLVVSVFTSHLKNENSFAFATRHQTLPDDSYRTIQPLSNVGKTINVNESWSLKQQIAQTERIKRISEAIAQQSSWNGLYRPHTWIAVMSPATRPLPSTPSYYQVRSVVRTTVSPDPPPDKEVYQAY
ncbi:MAG: anti-sigma factor family protein [Candidatus Zixiibacteriota bacterium]